MIAATTATISATAQESPYNGNEAAPGSFYLYNVESGMWLQNNDRRTDHYTTRAELDKRGFDVIITQEGEGFRLNPRFGGNHSINGSNLYMDTGDAVTSWKFVPVEEFSDGIAYTIESPYGKLGMGADGFLSENASENTTWQLVTRQERMASMETATEESPVDVTWLVECPNFGWTDERYAAWNASFNGGGNSVSGHDFVHCNTVHESWNSSMIDMRQTITGIPNGAYRVSVQGYYRDGDDPTGKYANGTEQLRTRFFANQISRPLMSSFAGGADTQDDIHTLHSAGKWAPNSMNAASVAFFNGEYRNTPILVEVTDGELSIGLSKPTSDGVQADWTVFDNWTVEYLGPEIDMTGVIAALREAIDAAREVAEDGTEAMNAALAKAIDNAEGLLESHDIMAVVDATEELENLTAAMLRAAATVNQLRLTAEIAEKENLATFYPEKIEAAYAAMKEATSISQLNDVLEDLRIARKMNAADKQENSFTGQAPAAGQFYLYNVGRKQFLCGGSDWGAHAALGFPGIPVTLEGSARASFRIRTGLDNGNGDWLNHNGYCDTPDKDSWKFVEVEGMPRVYNIVQAGNLSIGLAYNPYARTDAGENVHFHANVGTGENVTDNADAQWMLVTAAERDALLDDATPDNPADASYLIKMPNFNQREYGNSAWNQESGAWAYNIGGIDGRGTRREDFIFMVEDGNQAFEITQTLTGLRKGKYIVSVQGFYRDGSKNDIDETVANGDTPRRLALLYANEAEVALSDILECADMAPGYGYESAAGEIPDGAVSAANYFQNGLYRNSIEVYVGNDGILSIGVVKERVVSGDWLAIDNFRLSYLGDDLGGIGEVTTDRQTDTRIYTLGGVEVKAPLQPGIYIRAGRKIVVR